MRSLAVVVQLCTHVQLFVTPWTAAYQVSLSLTISQSLPKFIPLHWWCHPAISSSDALFSFCPQSFPASGTFPMSRLLASDDQNTGASASASVLSMSTQGWFTIRLTGLILQWPARSLLQSHSSKASTLWCSAFFMVQLSQPYLTTGKTIALTIQTFVARVMSLLLNTVSRFVIAFLSRSSPLLTREPMISFLWN